MLSAMQFTTLCCWLAVVTMMCQPGAAWHPTLANPVMRAHEPLVSAPGSEEECAPQQVHLALGKDPTIMYISWKTEGANCASEVSYGRARDDDSFDAITANRAVGYCFLLSERDMCSSAAAHNSFELYLHRAELRELLPGERYSYRVAAAQRSRTFRAAPAVGDARRVTFAAFGDMGESTHPRAKSPGADLTVATLTEEVSNLDLVLHVGDIAYANGNPDIWDTFMDSIEPIAAHVPYMVAIGNHEYDYTGGVDNDPSGAKSSYHPGWGNFGDDSGGECGVMTARRFHMPRQKPTHNPPFWYSFAYGSVQFIAISTEHDITPGSAQHQWLEAELADVDRCTTPWLVLLLHRPMYVVYPHKSNRFVADHLRSSLEALLLQHKVDLTLAGHVHSYYRTCPVYDEECVDNSQEEDACHRGMGGSCRGNVSQCGSRRQLRSRQLLPRQQPLPQQQHQRQAQEQQQHKHHPQHGVTHFVIGTGGHVLSDVSSGQEEWVAAKAQHWGYGRFTVDGDERLLAEFVSSKDGRVLDSVVLRGSGAGGQACATKRRSRGANEGWTSR